MSNGKNYSSEIKKKIKECIEKGTGFEYGKSGRYLSHRVKLSIEEIELELKEAKDLVFTNKKEINGEIRYPFILFMVNEVGEFM
ncbi:hypothetical protein J4205_02280 [Candidatus Pacearchaeota archaeon]|nr:hypothetical protein [Candidatus Pacearchaeota archaeon]